MIPENYLLDERSYKRAFRPLAKVHSCCFVYLFQHVGFSPCLLESVGMSLPMSSRPFFGHDAPKGPSSNSATSMHPQGQHRRVGDVGCFVDGPTVLFSPEIMTPILFEVYGPIIFDIINIIE